MPGTNKIVLRTQDEFLADFKPTYNALMPLFLAGNRARQYSVEDGQVNFKRVEAMGDLRGKIFGSKDTEMTQILAREGTKGFKKYFFAAQYVQSRLQDRQGYEDVVAQVLDEHNKYNDELFLTGGGTSNGNVVNNGLFFSADPNYTHEPSVVVPLASGDANLHGLYSLVASKLEASNSNDGEKLVLFYGSATLAKTNSLFVGTDKPFMGTLKEAFEGASFQKLPAAVTPAGEGFMVINLDQIKTHWTLLPSIRGQGVNEEKEYAWTNFLMGSSMVEVLIKGAVTRQPVTYAT